MKIDFYYWGTQCPIIYETIRLLNKYIGRLEIYFYDITNNHRLAEQQKMFFPFLTVVDDKHRYRGPINDNLIENFLIGNMIKEEPYIIPLATDIYMGDVIPLTIKNIALVSNGCTMSKCGEACSKKGGSGVPIVFRCSI